MSESQEALTLPEIFTRIDESIDRHFTPEVLVKLAANGWAPDDARDYLRLRVLGAILEASNADA